MVRSLTDGAAGQACTAYAGALGVGTVLEPEGNVPAEVLAAILELGTPVIGERGRGDAWVDSKRQALKKKLSKLRQDLETMDVQAVVDSDAERAAKEFSGRLFEALEAIRKIEPSLYPERFVELEHQLDKAWLHLEYIKDPARPVLRKDFAFSDELLDFAHRLSPMPELTSSHDSPRGNRARRKSPPTKTRK